MQKFILFIFAFVTAFVSFSCASAPSRSVAEKDDKEQKPEVVLTQGDVIFERRLINHENTTQRIGMFLESPSVPFKGCIMYLEAFGDSIQNHYPLFNKLRQQGYRIIGFDYLGQGGSEGSMNNTSVGDISQAAKMVWESYSTGKDEIYHRSCAHSKKRVLGWSLGGLVGYYLAQEKWSDTSVLLNPLLAPKDPAGESDGTHFPWFASSEVTRRTLTRNQFDRYTDPHLDPIKPQSYSEAWMFVQSMKLDAAGARNAKIDGSNQKLMFLFSDSFDHYVDNQESRRVIDANVKSFYRTQSFAEALHELDNELPEVSEPVHQYVIDFFNDN